MSSPCHRDEIIAALERQEADSLAYWNAFDLAAFFRPSGSSWSPAETVRHLNKSTWPVVKALSMPRLVLRLLFGKSARPSMTYEEFVTKYRQALAEGGNAGRFAPEQRTEVDFDAWRAKIMDNFMRSHQRLRAAIARWPDAKLDTLRLPHPLLGKLTMREMLIFTLYHHRHHVDVVKRRIAEAS